MGTTPPPSPLSLKFLIDAYGSFMSAMLGRFGVLAADVPDARQDVLCVVAAQLDTFVLKEQPSPDGPLRGWLYVICANKAAEYRRARRKAMLCGPLDEAERLPSDLPATDVLLALRREIETLRPLIEALVPERRAVVSAYVCAQLTMPEVAAHLAIPEATAWSRLYLAVADLRASYRRRGRHRRDGMLLLLPFLCDGVLENGGAGSGAPSIATGALSRRPAERTPWRAARRLASVALFAAALAGLDVRLSIARAGEQPLTAQLPGQGYADTPPAPDVPSSAPLARLPPRAPSTAEAAPLLADSDTPSSSQRPGLIRSAPAAPKAPPRREERAFLAKAQEALAAGKLDDARTALAAHHRKFPNSVLADLRERLEGKVERASASR